MAKNKKIKTLSWIAGILALILLIVGSTQFSIYGRSVWLPQYWTAECVARADNMQELDLGKVPNEGKFYPCTTESAGKWIPEVAGVQCEFYTTRSTSFNLDVYVCSEDATASTISDKCTKVKGFIIDANRDRFSVDVKKKLYVNPTSTFGLGSTYLSAKYPSYGLRVRDAQGFVQKQSTNCIASSVKDVISGQVHTLDLQNRIVVVPGAPFNAVTGLSPAISTQVVTLSEVNGGKPIYISRPGFYFNVAKAEDGWEFVDTTQEFSSSSIECIPRTNGCSDEAKIVQLVDQSCDIYGGAITDYAPVQGNPTKLCKYSCTGGKLSLTSDCIAVQSECPADKPLWDATTGKCVTIIEHSEDNDESDLLFWVLLIGGAAFAIILMLIIKLRSMQK